MSGSRQKNLLLLLGALVLIAAWRYLRPSNAGGAAGNLAGPASQRPGVDEEGDGPRRARAAGAGEVKKARPGDRVSQIHIADLDHVPALGTGGRDPWRFVDPPPPPPPTPPKPRELTPAEIEAMRREAERRAEQERLAAIERAKPKPAEFNLQYIGHFGSEATKVAVFSDGKKEFIAAEGDTLDKKFIVARIGLESVEIRFVGFPDWPAKRVGIGRR